MVRRRHYLQVSLLVLAGTCRGPVWAAIPDPVAPRVFIVVDPPLPQPPPQDLEPTILPIVNAGFANDQDVAGPIRPLIEKLSSQAYADREEATRALLRLPPGRLDEVVEALSKETDSEAIERLTQIAAHLFLKPRTLLKTRASLLGVWFKEPSRSLLGLKFKMDPVKLRPTDASPTVTVMVTELQIGFPAMQTLRNGDRIVAIGGVGFPDGSELELTYFQSRVAALWPGAIIPMTILRDGRLMELGVQVTGLPLDGPSRPEEMINARTTALNAFLRSLKTGDKNQAALPAPTQPPALYVFPE